jgi:DNA-nicking Smr family endonuclease
MLSSSLDLHGLKHKEVEERLEQFFFWEKPGYKQYKIITGNSYEMKRIVTRWLDKHEYYYYIPSHNLGEIQITE